MHPKLLLLCGASVRETGAITSQRGESTGLYVTPGGYLIYTESGQVVGTITLAGRIYDLHSRLIARVERLDHRAMANQRDIIHELSGALGLI